MKRNPPCPHCGQTTVVKNGRLSIVKAEAVKYFCSSCEKYFSTFTRTVFYYLNFPPQAVAFALELMQDFGLSLTQTKLLVKRLFNVEVSKATLSLWNKKLSKAELELPAVEFANVWHVDEMFVKHEQRSKQGKKKCFDYLWVVCDSKQQVIAMHYSRNRDLQSAKTVLSKARFRAGFVPRVIVSDDYLVYPRAVRCVLRGALHVTAHFQPKTFFWNGEAWSLTNNIVESLNSRLRDRLRRKRGLKNFDSATRFFKLLQAIWNSRFTKSLAAALLNTIPRLA